MCKRKYILCLVSFYVVINNAVALSQVIGSDTKNQKIGKEILAAISIPKAINYIVDKTLLADINGDGVEDIIVLNNNLKTIDIYNNKLSSKFTINLKENISGSSICTGDFNGDSIDDILVTQIQKEEIGRAFLYFGSKKLEDIKQDIVIEGYPGYFGYSCTNIGDVNKDGNQDFAISAYTAGSERQGMVYVFYGGPNLDNKPDIQLTGLQGESSFGYNISGIGDINKDGFDDFIVGAPTGGAIQAGQAFVFLGGSPMDTKPALTLEGENTDDFFGGVIASCLNKDWPQKSDFIIGAYENDEIGESSGKVYAFEGKWPLPSKPLNIWKGEAVGDCFGYSLAAGYSVNGDEKWEWFVGAPFNDEGGQDAGKVYIYPLGIPDSHADEYAEIPVSLQLFQNYPNPFNHSTLIKFGMPTPGNVSLYIYNILGRKIKTIYNNTPQKVGYQTIQWDGLDDYGCSVSSGLYFVQLTTPKERRLIKIMLVK